MGKFKLYIIGSFVILAATVWSVATLAQHPHTTLHLYNSTYSADYCVECHDPVFVEWVLRKIDVVKSKVKRPHYFRPDNRLPKPRVKHGDYTKTGYARGHMCPSADRSTSKEACRETFLMSNVCPMTDTLNDGVWKRLEIESRRLAVAFDSVRVSAYALFLPSPDKCKICGFVQVPSHFIRQVRKADNDSLLLWALVDQSGRVWGYQDLLPK